MKFFTQLFIALIFIAINFSSNAQCFEIESILVDACGSPEGENEMVRFKVGSVDLCTNDLTVSWANTGNSWLGLTQNAVTAQITTNLNATILGCGELIEPTSCVLPANSTVILITSTDIDVSANSFAGLNETIYVIYQTAGNTAGHFANNGTGIRTLTMNFSNPIGCVDAVSYDRAELININGTTGGNAALNNGSTVNFDPAGTPTYINNGCQAPFEPFEVDMTGAEVISGTQNICPGDVIQIGVNITGPYDEIIWEGLNGTFDAQDVTTTNYNSAANDNVDFYIYVNVETICGDIIQDSVLFTVNASPTVSAAGPYTTIDGTQNIVADIGGGTWSADCGVCINSTTGVFDPAVSGEGIFQICYDAGCGQDCISILVDDDCTMSLTVSGNSPSCYNSNDGSINVGVAGVVGTASYEITNANGDMVNVTTASNVANNLVAGVYTVSVTDDLCTVTEVVTLINELEIIPIVNLLEPNCYGIADGFAYVDTLNPHQGTYDQVSFLWEMDVNGVPTVLSQIDTLANFGEGDYSLTVVDEAGCVKEYSFIITYPDSIYLELEVARSAICRKNVILNDPDGQLFAVATGGKDDGNFPTAYWTQLSTGNINNSSTWGQRPAGDYSYTVEDQYGCTTTQFIVLDSLSPQADFTISSPQFTSDFVGTVPVTVTFENNSTNYSFANNPLYPNGANSNVDTAFIWTFGLVNDPFETESLDDITKEYTSAGVYNVCLTVVENKGQCVDSSCVEITIYDQPSLDVPNVFTPDNDGINDEFFFPNSAIEEFNCKVYDRWGKQVYEFTNITDVWNGTNYKNDRECTAGVYFYIYEAKSSNATEYKGQGNIQLIRKY